MSDLDERVADLEALFDLTGNLLSQMQENAEKQETEMIRLAENVMHLRYETNAMTLAVAFLGRTVPQLCQDEYPGLMARIYDSSVDQMGVEGRVYAERVLETLSAWKGR